MSDEETTKGGVAFVTDAGRGAGTEEPGVRLLETPVGKAGILVVLLLPIGLARRVGKFEFRLLGDLSEGGTVGFLVRRDDLRVLVLRVVANDRATMTVRGIKLAVTAKAALEFAQQCV